METGPRTAAGRLFAFVAVTERRRRVVTVAIPALFVLVLDVVANFGVMILLLGAALAVFLYTRPTVQETVAASAYGVGGLLVGLFALVLYWNGAQGSTEPLLDAAARVGWWAAVGTALIGLGLWLRSLDV